jgi:hypothetical protein
MVLPIAGGIGLATRTDGAPDSQSTPQTYFPDLIRGAARQAWTEYRTRLRQLLLAELGKGDLISPGVTLYDIVLNVAEDVDLTVDRDDAGDLVVHLVTGTTYLEATSTTPTDLGAWADPRFSFAFGLDLTYRIDLPPTTQPLHATGFESIHVLSPVLDSHGFVADVVFMVNDIVDWFTGTDYVALLERFIASTDFAPYVNDALTPLNDELNRLAAEGFWFLEAVVDRLDGGSGALHGLSLPGAPQGRLDLFLTAYGFDRSGAVEGLITWPRTLGEPTNRRKLDVSSAVSQELTIGQLSSATAAALQSERTAGWTAATVSLGEQVPDASAPSASAVPASAEVADATVATSLEAMAVPERTVAAQELRAGVADRFVAMIGGAERFAELRAAFLRGREDMVVTVTTAAGGSGLFADQRPVGEMAHLWAEDDDTTRRRRYLVVDVPIEAPLNVTCGLAPGYRWEGTVDQVVCEPARWNGTVTVHPARSVAERFDDQVEIRLPDSSRAFGRADDLDERGIIIVSGHGRLGDEVQLNPQPLPPREVAVDVGVARQGLERLSGTAVSQVSITRSEAATSGVAEQATTVTAEQDPRWGHRVIQLDETVAEIAATELTRQNPSGAGTARGIDFRVTEYQAPVIR